MKDNSPELEIILRRFPKVRPHLPEEYKRVFQSEYIDNREGNNVASQIAIALEKWMHKKVSQHPKDYPLLEIGGGTLNHTKFELSQGIYDVIEPFKILYQNKDEKMRINDFYSDIADIPDGKKYRRIVSTAVLEHILDLPAVIARSAILLDKSGEFRAGIPTEGGLLWYLAWRFGTGLSFRIRHGLSYKTLMQSEHVNNANEIEQIVSYFYDTVKVIRYPLPIFHFSFYTCLIASNPNFDRARSYLDKY